MPPSTPTKTLSPAELSKLEHAFATDPSSEAYRPLAEAYLGMGRFMEAMVVCKKGVKAHPNVADPRVLLARVYAEQGKDKKALEELAGALQVAPEDKAALRMTGALQMKGGEVDAGRGHLLKAYAADPSDEETRALLAQWKIPPPAAAPKAAPAPATPAPSGRAAQTEPEMEIDAQPTRRVQRVNGTAARAAAASVAEQPVRGSQARRAAPVVDDDDDADDDVSYRPRRAASTKKSFVTFLVMVLVALGSLAGYAVYGNYRAIRNREIKKLLTEATEQLKHDSYDSYRKASEAADKALELDASSTAAHGYLAYAYAIRWGEHGGGDDARRLAEEHLEAARKGGELSSHRYAAEALIQAYAGKGREALSSLEERVRAFDAQGKKSSLMYLTLGIIQMNAGDLERARESLDTAQQLASDDPRVYAALGTLYRRRGQDSEAWKNFDFALKFRGDHPESMLGMSQLILDQEEPQPAAYINAARMLKKLLESQPPPSPRQLAAANLTRALLVSRVSTDIPLYEDASVQKKLTEGTDVSRDKDKARDEIKKAEETGFSLDRSNPELHLIRAKRLGYERNYAEAAAEIRKAIQMDGSRAHFHIELARVLMKKEGGEKEAEEALRKALGMMPDSPKLLAMLGEALERQGKNEEALRQYERAITDPKAKNPEARLALGRLYRDVKKDHSKAMEAFNRAAVEYVGQPQFVARAYAELGVTHQLKGERAKAKSAFEKALNADEDIAEAYFYYARLLSEEPSERGKVRELAQEYLKRAPRGEYASEAQRLVQM